MEIHKKLLASISPELNKHVNNYRRKDIKGIINLPDDREEVLTLFTEWAYTGDYTHKGIQLGSPPGPEDPWPPLYNHLQLCVFAAKFNIPALGELAGSKFYTEINRIEPSSQRDATCLVMVIGYAYNNLPGSHPTLKFLAKYASWKLGFLRGTTAFKQLTSSHPDFLEEFLLHLNGLNAKPMAPQNYPQHPQNQQQWQYASQYEPQYASQYEPQYSSQYASQYEPQYEPQHEPQHASPMPTGYNGGGY